MSSLLIANWLYNVVSPCIFSYIRPGPRIEIFHALNIVPQNYTTPRALNVINGLYEETESVSLCCRQFRSELNQNVSFQASHYIPFRPPIGQPLRQPAGQSVVHQSSLRTMRLWASSGAAESVNWLKSSKSFATASAAEPHQWRRRCYAVRPCSLWSLGTCASPPNTAFTLQVNVDEFRDITVISVSCRYAYF